MKIPSLPLALLSLIAPLAAVAEEPDSIKRTVEEQLFRVSATSGVYLSQESDLEGDEGFGFSSLETNLTVPLFGKKITDDIRLAFSTRYRYTQLDFDDGFFEDQELHGIDLSADIIWKPENSKWQAWTRLRPELYSDFNNIGDKAWGGTVISTIGYSFSEDLAVAVGVYAGRELGDYRVFPAIGILWDVTNTLRLELIPPIPTLKWIPDERWEIKLGAFPSGGSWEIESDDGSGADTINYRNFRVGLGVERQLVGRLWLNGWVGANTLQTVEIEADDRRIEKRDIDESLFGYVGVRYYFW